MKHFLRFEKSVIMRIYQILSLISGILGITIAFAFYFLMKIFYATLNSFGSGIYGEELINILTGVSIILYTFAIIIPFVIKKTKFVGICLVVLSFATLISAGGFGILGFALLLSAGIIAIKWKEEPLRDNPIEILKERFAKGEITVEEFEDKKKELDTM